MELIFEIRDAEEGGYCARALGHPIFTEAEKSWRRYRCTLRRPPSVLIWFNCPTLGTSWSPSKLWSYRVECPQIGLSERWSASVAGRSVV